MQTLSREPQVLTSSPQGGEHPSEQDSQPLLSPSPELSEKHLAMHLLPGPHL